MYLHLFLTWALYGSERVASRPPPRYPRERSPRYTLNRTQGGPRNQSGCFKEINPSPLQGLEAQFTNARTNLLTRVSQNCGPFRFPCLDLKTKIFILLTNMRDYATVSECSSVVPVRVGPYTAVRSGLVCSTRLCS